MTHVSASTSAWKALITWPIRRSRSSVGVLLKSRITWAGVGAYIRQSSDSCTSCAAEGSYLLEGFAADSGVLLVVGDAKRLPVQRFVPLRR